MRSLLCILLFAASLASWAQTPYTGGIGDGHATASIQLAPVAESAVYQEFEAYPTMLRPHQQIKIPDDIHAKEAYLVSLDGRMSTLPFIAPHVLRLEGTKSAGYYVLQLRADDAHIYYCKLIVLPD